MTDPSPPRTFRGTSFTYVDNERRTGEQVDLDGRHFRGGRYRECVLIYRGDQAFLCTDTVFEHCILKAEGTARRVLRELAAFFDFAPLVGLLEQARQEASVRPEVIDARRGDPPVRLSQWGERMKP